MLLLPMHRRFGSRSRGMGSLADVRRRGGECMLSFGKTRPAARAFGGAGGLEALDTLADRQRRATSVAVLVGEIRGRGRETELEVAQGGSEVAFFDLASRPRCACGAAARGMNRTNRCRGSQ